MADPPFWSLGAHVDGESNIGEVPFLGPASVPPAQTAVMRAARELAEMQLRDSLLGANSGRWNPGGADPAVFVPGDVAAVRGLTSSSAIANAVGMANHAAQYGRAGDTVMELEGLRSAAFHISVAKMLLTAVPFFIPEPMIEAVCSSDPPDAASLASVRLPFPLMLVMFGKDVPLDPGIFEEVSLDAVPEEALLSKVSTLGGYLTGVVLLAEQDGTLADRFMWLLTANPDPQLPYPANLDRIRGAVIGRRSCASMAGLVETIAGVVTWAPWSPVPRTIDVPTERVQKESRSGKFKRWEPQGGLVRDLRVISYQPPAERHHDEPQGGRRTPREHTRRGHFRRVLVGEGVRSLPADLRTHETRWIPPTLVNPGEGGVDRPVYRITSRKNRVTT